MLTSAQQSALDYHLRETNLLTNEELILELTDHYTTALLDRMAQGMTFETALTDTQRAFGGRRGLQQMERQYNRVTFRHYDERWLQAVRTQFQKALLWRQTVPIYGVLLLVSCIILMPNPVVSPKWDSFIDGILPGFLSGIAITFLGMLGPYLKAIIQKGIHNVPTETLYLVTRRGLSILMIFSTGVAGHFWLLPLLPSPMQAILASLYLASLSLFVLTSYDVEQLLYDYEPSR